MARDDACPPAAPLIGGRTVMLPGHDCVRAHGLSDWVLWCTLSGTVSARHRDGETVSGRDEAVLIAPRTPHDYRTTGAKPWECLWIAFQPRPLWLEWMQWPAAGPGVGRLNLAREAAGRVCSRLREAIALAAGIGAEREALAMNALEAALLWCRTQDPDPRVARLDPRLRAAVDFMCDRLREAIDVAAAARAAGVSRPHLTRLFRRQLDTTPQRFLEERRLERARHLLRATAMGVGEIADEVGFASPFYFSLRFARRTGLSPRAWRQRAVADGDA